MAERTVQLVLHYDGGLFSGWQRQPDRRTVQDVLEQALGQVCCSPVAALGSGRTDAGVHARGQAVGVRVPDHWTAIRLRRALNAVLPEDVWIASAADMRPDFHARYSARSRTYRYRVGTDDSAHSPFRRRWELAVTRDLDRGLLHAAASDFEGDHSFRAFSVLGTAPVGDEHRCHITMSRWHERAGGLDYEVRANRFLHRMVRFLVGTMLDVAQHRRPLDDVRRLLSGGDNRDTSPPAAPHGLYLETVEYPPELYTELA